LSWLARIYRVVCANAGDISVRTVSSGLIYRQSV
jgi:hypothetical protein